MYGVGQGLQKGVEMAGAFLVPAMRDKMALQNREKLYDKQLKAQSGITDGSALALQTSGPMRAPMGAPMGAGPEDGPGAALAGMPAQASAAANPALTPGQPGQAGVNPGASSPGAGPLAGVEAEAFTPLSEEEVYTMYRNAAEQRTRQQIQTADEMDIARGWQRSFTQLNNVRRSLSAIQNALKDPSGNGAMLLVPQAQDADQARQILSGEYMKLLQQYKPLEQEHTLWDSKRHELGIDPKEIDSDVGVARFLNRKQLQSRSGPKAPSARSVLPNPSRTR